jgi:hypothetical protein
MIVWLIDYLLFYVPLKNVSLIWIRHHCRWRTAKCRSILGAQGLFAGRDLYRATPAVTWGLGFYGLIRRTAPFSRLLRHTRMCGGSIITRILRVVCDIQNLRVFQCGTLRNDHWSNNRHMYLKDTDFALFCTQIYIKPMLLQNRGFDKNMF